MKALSKILLGFLLMHQRNLVIGMRCCWSQTCTDTITNSNQSLRMLHNPLITDIEELNLDVIGYLSNSHYCDMPIVVREKYFSALFESRKEMIMASINNIPTARKHENSFLLILNDKNSIYFSLTSRATQTHRVLHKHEMIFFRSINYENTTIVIRRGFLELIDHLATISGIQKLSAALYLKDGIQCTQTELDEIISVITFIELYYNHFHCHQMANRKFVMDFVYLTPLNQRKTLTALNEYVPLNLYKKLIIIDDLGVHGWNTTAIFSYLQQKIVPIQSTNIEVVEPMNIIKDLFYPTLCSKIHIYCQVLPKDFGFLDHWIGSVVRT